MLYGSCSGTQEWASDASWGEMMGVKDHSGQDQRPRESDRQLRVESKKKEKKKDCLEVKGKYKHTERLL